MHLARLVDLVELDKERESLMDENTGDTAKRLIGLLGSTKNYADFKIILEYIRGSLTIRSEVLRKYMKEFKEALYINCFKKLNSQNLTLEEAQRINSIAHNLCQTEEDDRGKMGDLCKTAERVIETLLSKK